MLWVKPLRRLLHRPAAISCFHTTATSWTPREDFQRFKLGFRYNAVIECEVIKHHSLIEVRMIQNRQPHGREYVHLSGSELRETFDEALKYKGTLEVFIELLEGYEFDLSALKAVLVAEGLDVSSEMEYNQIAPFVGLKPSLCLEDAPTFKMHRARIPNVLFREIIEDIEIVMKQYGPPGDQNVAARSRFLAPVFNRAAALFGLLIKNTPISIMPGTTKGLNKYQFKLFEGITVIYIVVEFKLKGTAKEHLDAVTQLIAEAEGCDFANRHLGFSALPIYGILSDGESFEFFCFDSSTKPPTFSRYQHSSMPECYALSVAELSGQSTMDFVASLRPICETIFYFLLLGYTSGIHAHYHRLYSRQLQLRDESGKRQGSTDAWTCWQTADRHVEQALEYAIAATAQAAAGDYIQADKVANDASEQLKASIAGAHSIYQWKECNIMQKWDLDRVNAA